MKIIMLNLKELIMLPKTKNFNPLVDLKLSCTCGEDGCDKRSTKQMLLNMLQKVRDDYGLPMIVTSGGRCPLHPGVVAAGSRRAAGDSSPGYCGTLST